MVTRDGRNYNETTHVPGVVGEYNTYQCGSLRWIVFLDQIFVILNWAQEGVGFLLCWQSPTKLFSHIKLTPVINSNFLS